MAALPGRPGNLTPEEEEKLRKFWEMFLQLCGVYEEDGADNDSPVPLASQGKQATAGSEKPKKKRLGLFKKKKAKENSGSDKDAVETPKSSDVEDKWGESKAYHETLAKHSPEAIRATIWSMVKHDNPDALLLRFLRARKWDLQRALVMMISSMNWRLSEMHVDDEIMVKGEEHQLSEEKSSDDATKKHASDFLAQMRLGKSYNYGIDKTGRPICICRARLHKAGEHSEQSLERYTVYLIETTRFLLEPPNDTGCVIFDLTGFSLANMDYTPVKFMIRCFEANYPESLGIVLVHKAPQLIVQIGIWKIIRGWLDPVVANKVNFTNNIKDLEAFIDVDELPTELEGTSGWSYRYVEPLAGENDKMNDMETRHRLLKEREAIYEEYESKTIEWLNESDASKRTTINTERSSIAKKLKEQYWQLDPYVRARSLYDRVGMLKPGGKVDYYSSWETPKKTAAEKPTNGAPAAATADDDVD
ncbi:CRAL/TRIO domain-containing protein [Xylariaceae sp. FL1019]|nr:CRAL/TRIO domain-containing protein [Xylariaceae sp. FL1019]